VKKCIDCHANHNNLYCELGYKTEELKSKVLDYTFYHISPLEKCIKPKNKKEFISMYKAKIKT
jgi:hypothetical protein